MSQINRRDFARALGTIALVSELTATAAFSPFANAKAAPKVVIVGGGAGGTSLAVNIKRLAPAVDVTLIESNRTYSTPFFTNSYLGGLLPLSSLSHDYGGLRKLGIRVVIDRATGIDTDRKTVLVSGGHRFAYDRLVLAPGIDLKYDSLPGYSREAAELLPHAYTSDPAQKLILRRQLEAMRDGGVVILVMPHYPYRCPPAPYERACAIAWYLKNYKPKSKLVILDPKKEIPLQTAFTEAFSKYYKDIIEFNLSTELDDFTAVQIDAQARQIETKGGRKWQGDVVSVIPQQRAGEIAHLAGCTEGDWCPVDPENYTSTRSPHIHVIGDASWAPPVPKSAFLANSQAKLVAARIVAELSGSHSPQPEYLNTCWALVAPDDFIKTGARYAPVNGKLTELDAFVSAVGEGAEIRKRNYAEGRAWYTRISNEMFAGSAGQEKGSAGA